MALLADPLDRVPVHCRAHDYADPGKPKIAWYDEQAWSVLVDALVSDALRLLGHLSEQDLGPRGADAVAILALVAGQDVEPADGSDGTNGRWRIARRTAPDRVVSTVDPEARHVHKTRSHRQEGFNAHLRIEPETGLITASPCGRRAAANPTRPPSPPACWLRRRDSCRSWPTPPIPARTYGLASPPPDTGCPSSPDR